MSVDACRCRWWSRDNLQSVRRSRHAPKMENLSALHVQIRAIGGSLVWRRPTQCPFSTSTSALALSQSHLHLQLLSLSVRPSTVLPCWRGRCDAGHHSGLRCISSWSEYLVHNLSHNALTASRSPLPWAAWAYGGDLCDTQHCLASRACAEGRANGTRPGPAMRARLRTIARRCRSFRGSVNSRQVFLDVDARRGAG